MGLPDGVAAGDLLAALPDSVILLDADGTIVGFGPTGGDTFGWSPHDVLGRKVFEMFAKAANHDLHVEALARAVAEPGVHGPIEVTMVTPDGRLREAEWMLTNALDRPGVGALVAIGRDITDRDSQSEEYRKRDAWASSLLRGATDLILVTDRGGRIAYASPSVERILGCSADEITGLLITSVVHPDDLLAEPGDGVHLDRILGTGPGRQRVLRLQAGDGSYKRLRMDRTTSDELGDHLLLLTGREVQGDRDAADLLSDQTVLLERIARGAPVGESLLAVADLAARRLGDGEVVIGYSDGSAYLAESPSVDDELLAVLDRTGISRPPLQPAPPEADTIRTNDGWDSVVKAASGGRSVRAFAVDLTGSEGLVGRLVFLRHHDEDLTPEERDLVALAVDLATIAVDRHHLQAR
ncbi:MAG: PAS domain-containing protein, partial [Aquihabitans sp.]